MQRAILTVSLGIVAASGVTDIRKSQRPAIRPNKLWQDNRISSASRQ